MDYVRKYETKTGVEPSSGRREREVVVVKNNGESNDLLPIHVMDKSLARVINILHGNAGRGMSLVERRDQAADATRTRRVSRRQMLSTQCSPRCSESPSVQRRESDATVAQ